ncbi:hypothetical protein BDV41DRAFT_566145 [Aspergillus transmontanensis]|uniref:Uncharacterized protein n=1 Tax=Aspergillus transmontanensis TaxID=1034304 RepID=A0A5N6VR51_9EURO|nr:hypothetical protein BDV41DRAFT_566145 [Aspergillus transmontanensis]
MQKHLDIKRVIHSGIRQTHLEWNSDCTAIERYFDTEIKPRVDMLRRKSCTNRLFVQFHEYRENKEIYKPQTGPGKYTVLIVVNPGPGFPLLCDGTQGSDGNRSFTLRDITQIPDEKGAVVIFEASIARKEPVVKGNGGSCILLAYQE